MKKERIAKVEELSPGESLGTIVNGLAIAVFNVDGEYYAIQNRCMHKGGPMFKGEVDCVDGDCSVYCPWHYLEFDLETGLAPINDEHRLRTFKVEEEDGYIVVTV